MGFVRQRPSGARTVSDAVTRLQYAPDGQRVAGSSPVGSGGGSHIAKASLLPTAPQLIGEVFNAALGCGLVLRRCAGRNGRIIRRAMATPLGSARRDLFRARQVSCELGGSLCSMIVGFLPRSALVMKVHCPTSSGNFATMHATA